MNFLNFERLFLKKLYNENTRPTITSFLIMIMRKNIYIIIVTNFQIRLSEYFVFCHYLANIIGSNQQFKKCYQNALD